VFLVPIKLVNLSLNFCKKILHILKFKLIDYSSSLNELKKWLNFSSSGGDFGSSDVGWVEKVKRQKYWWNYKNIQGPKSKLNLQKKFHLLPHQNRSQANPFFHLLLMAAATYYQFFLQPYMRLDGVFYIMSVVWIKTKSMHPPSIYDANST
jgi:hypothetical protein